MNIGEKIKQIRTAKYMTQSQLAGDFITRNMLSRIENGAAMPSLSTVVYLAQRLKVPAGYLLSEGSEEYIYRKINNIDNIKRALTNGDFEICRDICLSLGGGDDEIWMILARCVSGLAEDDFFHGRLHSSMRRFDEAREYDQRTIYSIGLIRSKAAVYQRYMHSISPTLMTDSTDTNINAVTAANDPICEYILTLEAAESHPEIPVHTLLDSAQMSIDSPLSTHITARDEMRHKNFAGAQQLLLHILNMQERIPDPILYNVFYDLEICSKETDNYRDAYEYSADKVNLLERMLTETEVI